MGLLSEWLFDPNADEDFFRAVDNLFSGLLVVAREALPYLEDDGDITFTSTIFSRTIYPGRASYSGPKAAGNPSARHLVRNLTNVGRAYVRVNTTFPAGVEGPRISKVWKVMESLLGLNSGTM